MRYVSNCYDREVLQILFVLGHSVEYCIVGGCVCVECI